ncbi:ATP-dependent helicase [Nitrosopumilus sp.]|uniref:ATP-dependent helicase n=1 Tax=Nitrosopumilus sp. TaxID=2024843 RepID=UPI00349FF551
MKLDSTQMKAVEHKGSPLLVTAGPGSGKTRVITERVKFLVRDGLDPSEILCLTFSEKAASELRGRLEDDDEIKGKYDLSEMQISTYHAFCRSLLLENTTATGLGMKGGVLDRSVFLVWGVQNIDKFGFDRHVVIGNNAYDLIEKMVDGISVFNQELISPDELKKYVYKKLKEESSIADVDEFDYLHQMDNLVKIYKKYVEFKKKIDVMDYDDLIVEANRLLENKDQPHVLKRVQEKFKHVLIDEFQDNNFAQFALVKKIAKGGNVTAVGDADQNIYRFQGAYTQIFEDFKKTFPDYDEISLRKNFRNPKSVINLSGQLLAQDPLRDTKNIEHTKKEDSKVNVVECSSEIAQAEFIKNKIGELMKKNPGYSFRDFAILSRKQQDGLNIAKILASDGIPVKYVGKSRIHGSPSAQVLFAFLRIIADPMKSMTSIVRLLEEYGITPQNISKINREAGVRARGKTDGDYAFDVLSDLKVEHLTQKTQIRELFETINEFIKLSKDRTPSQVIYKIIRNKTDIYKKISNDDSIESFVERSVLNNVLNNAYDFEKINSEVTVKEFLEFTEQLNQFDVETKRDMSGDDAVQVSTIHKSKGLEFEVVFIADVATNRMPIKYSEKSFYVPQQIAKGVIPSATPKIEHTREERRILYVGMTRTISHLFLMYPTQYEDRSKANKASKFLEALKPKENDNVIFVKYDSNSNENISAPVDVFDVIKNEYIEKALKNLHSDQYQSAIQKIIEIAKIDFYKKNKSSDGFSYDGLLKYEPDPLTDERLAGTDPIEMGYENQKLSFSKFDDYSKCPKMFWYKHVLNALPANQEANALYKGTVFHKIVEGVDNPEMPEKKGDLRSLMSELELNWDQSNYLQSSVQKEAEDKQSLVPALKSYYNWNSKNKNTVTDVELKFSTHIGGFQVNGKIDRIEKTPEGDFVIIDYKTGGKNKKVEKVEESLQLNMYCIALQEHRKYGKLPKTASFFYVEKEEGQQFFDYDVSQSNVDTAKQVLQTLTESIKNKEFDATPQSFTCKYCDYNDICKDAEV